MLARHELVEEREGGKGAAELATGCRDEAATRFRRLPEPDRGQAGSERRIAVVDDGAGCPGRRSIAGEGGAYALAEGSLFRADREVHGRTAEARGRSGSGVRTSALCSPRAGAGRSGGKT